MSDSKPPLGALGLSATRLEAGDINLTGIGVILDLENRNAILAERIAQLSQMPAEGTSSESVPEAGDRASV